MGLLLVLIIRATFSVTLCVVNSEISKRKYKYYGGRK